MLNIMRLCLGTIARLFCARRSLLLENLALRQQLAVFKRRRLRARLTFLAKLFWVAARQICSDWVRQSPGGQISGMFTLEQKFHCQFCDGVGAGECGRVYA
jgi:predicted alpha/beta hydrolase